MSSAKDKNQYLNSMLISLPTDESFFCRANAYIDSHTSSKYCFIAAYVENFNNFAAWYGIEAASKLISDYCQLLSQQPDSVTGYVNGNHFVLITQNDNDYISGLCAQMNNMAKEYAGNIAFLPKFGIYNLDTPSLNCEEMYERAAIALDTIKGNVEKQICYFEQPMLEKVIHSRSLISDIHKALENNEITFYLQPQYNMSTGKIIGMEALVRWIHPERGVISPADFIPMLEKTGLIANVDTYLWDKVCAKLRHWIDTGIQPLPISVNVSRVDVYALDVPKFFNSLIEKYQLDRRLLEIEITESAYTSDNTKISEVIDTLRKDGFVVLMDDFGSAYSSLNMLKSVNVDVLKLDMKFLELERDNFIKGFGIVETVLRMARFMGLKIVMEGVETAEQHDYLVKVGCKFGQGYYMDRPMPVEACEAKLIDQNKLDFEGLNTRTIGRINTKELMQNEMFSEIMMNNFLGGMAVYEVYDGKIEILQVNEHYQHITGLSSDYLEKFGGQDLLPMIREKERDTVLSAFDRAFNRQLKGAECEYMRKTMDGRDIWVRLRMFFLREHDGRRRYCGVLRDVTRRHLMEDQLYDLTHPKK